MIFGIGCDISKTSRFEKWISDGLINRFFNEKEICETSSDAELTERKKSHLCQRYAARFAAKEAFSKALGTGITDFELKEVWIENEESGKPVLKVEGKAKAILEKLTEKKLEEIHILVSLSHEKEYAMAYVLIEI